MAQYRLFTRVCAFFLLLIGGSALLYGSWMTADIVALTRCGEQAEAQIIKSECKWRSVGRKGSRYWEITVRYTDKQGRVHEAMPPINDGEKRSMGETVMLYYRADDPQHVILDTRASRYAPTAIPFLLAFIFLGGGILLWRDCGKRA